MNRTARHPTSMPLWAAVCLACATLSHAAAEETYLPPSAVVPYGTAPHATEHLVSSAGTGKTYSLILHAGDEVLTALTEFAKRHSVSAAHFTAIGAVHDVKFGWLDIERKEYKVLHMDSQVEVLSLIGDIGVVDGSRPVVHAHVVLGDRDGGTHGGHLMHAVASPTVEIFITTGTAVLNKEPDAASGMTLFK